MNARTKALMKMKGGNKKITAKGHTLAKMEKNDEGKTKIGNYSYKR